MDIRITAQLLVALLAANLLPILVYGQVAWDDCASTQKGVFCLGGKDGVTAYPAGSGCFVDKDCQVAVIAKIEGDRVKWNFYLIHGKLITIYS